MIDRLRRMIERARWAARSWRLVADVSSFGQLVRLRLCDPSIKTVDVRLKPLSGQRVSARPGTADLWTIETLLVPDHLPPPEMNGQPSCIWDLGSNIGLTVAHMATLFQTARIVGVELDSANAALARLNISAWKERCTIIEAAVWPTDGRVAYEADVGQEHAFKAQRTPATEGRRRHTVRALALDTLLEMSANGEAVDYVKMDIEGTEREVLRENTGWANHVQTIKIEVHPPYTVAECVADVASLGFATRVPASLDPFGMPVVTGVRTR